MFKGAIGDVAMAAAIRCESFPTDEMVDEGWVTTISKQYTSIGSI